MSQTVGPSPAAQPRELPESAQRAVAKANLRKADDWKPLVGRALVRAIQLRGWSLKEFAGAVDRDPRQCARWLDGSERPQFDALFAIESFRQPLIVAFAEMAGAGVEVTTHISVRRIA